MKTLPIFLSFFSLIFFFSTQLVLVSAGGKCNPEDRKALFKLKKDLHNPYLLASWKPEFDCCSWYCVKCHPKTNRIYTLILSYGDISGHIPASVGGLPYLETLIIRKLPNLTGPIHPVIANLTRLTYLSLSWTNLSGPVPTFLSSLKNLQTLDLSHNQLTGSIPPFLSHLPKLSELYLDRNRLTGSIPESFRMLGKRPYLTLGKNQLSGEIPAGLARTDFVVIELFRNRLEGDASFLFGKNKSAWSIDLSRNKLSFDLSKVKELPPELSKFDISHNNIVGSLPAQLGKLRTLNLLNVSYNSLCGKIPAGGVMHEFDKYCFLHNKCLCGPPLGACKK